MLVCRSTVWADPPPEMCSDKCAERSYFIDSPSLQCYSFDPDSCSYCGPNGRCLTPTSDTKTCQDVIDRTTLTVYLNGCSPKCNLNFGQKSEATKSTAKQDSQAMITKWICKDPPPPPKGGELP